MGPRRRRRQRPRVPAALLPSTDRRHFATSRLLRLRRQAAHNHRWRPPTRRTNEKSLRATARRQCQRNGRRRRRLSAAATGGEKLNLSDEVCRVVRRQHCVIRFASRPSGLAGHVLYTCMRVCVRVTYVTKSDGSLLRSERQRAPVTDKVDCRATSQLDQLSAFDELLDLIAKKQKNNKLH